MANLRKLVAAALTASDLSESEWLETAVDRIASMAFTDTLGAELWRVRLANDARAYRRALLLLVRRTRHIAKSHDLRRRLCEVCLAEWADQNCRACGGRGFIINENRVQHVCTVCDGAGLRRYSDQWRMRRMGFSAEVYRKWERRFSAVHAKLSNADAAAWRDIAQQLEWIPGDAERRVLAFFNAAAKMRPATFERPAQNSDNMPDYALGTASATE